jgi:hypothetical protein
MGSPRDGDEELDIIAAGSKDDVSDIQIPREGATEMEE